MIQKKNLFVILALVALASGAFFFARSRHSHPEGMSDVTEGAPLIVQGSPSGSTQQKNEAPAASKPNLESLLAKASAEDRKQFQTHSQILKAKNDNDPRLDSELRHLSPEAKRLFEAHYAGLAAESRNERGTIVFLIGRDLKTDADIDFLTGVFAEPPCLSMGNCHEAPAHSKHDDEHFESANDVSLAYPQLAGLKQIEAYLGSGQTNPAVVNRLLALLEATKSSPVHPVSQLAGEILTRFKK